jgi:hypothetical protein
MKDHQDQYHFETQEKPTIKSSLRQNKGQLVVEYILLMFVAVSACALLTKGLVGRGEGNNGVVITKWSQLIQMVGNDLGD